jgi:hypothetical protein
MSQFLVLGQPLENLRLLSEGQYRTEAQARYEALNKNNNTFKTRFMNVAVISACAVLFFATISHLELKTMAGLFVVFVAAGLIIYPRPKKTEIEATTRQLF